MASSSARVAEDMGSRIAVILSRFTLMFLGGFEPLMLTSALPLSHTATHTHTRTHTHTHSHTLTHTHTHSHTHTLSHGACVSGPPVCTARKSRKSTLQSSLIIHVRGHDQREILTPPHPFPPPSLSSVRRWYWTRSSGPRQNRLPRAPKGTFSCPSPGVGHGRMSSGCGRICVLLP